MMQLFLHRLRDPHQWLQDQKVRSRWARRLWLWLGIGTSPRSLRRERYLQPDAACRVCQFCQEAARHYGASLADMLAHDGYRALYEQSQGICLPHLRTTLSAASSDQGLGYLLAHTEERLGRLRDDLEGLGDEYSLSHRHDTVSADAK